MANLDRLEQADGRQTAQAEAELQQVRGQVETAKRQLDEARRAAAGRTRSYAVVPYEGPNQTHRRPIYIECLADAVVLQPEGVRLTEADFEGPLGPGNPLAAALRAAREYMLAQHDFDPQAGEPYPMLLVRPEGIAAYYAARAAMKSWGGDFGYELIGDDWKLAYQPPDPRLAEVFRQVIATGRDERGPAGRRRPAAVRPGTRSGGGEGRGETGDEGDGGPGSASGWRQAGLGTSVAGRRRRGLGTSVPSSVGRSAGARDQRLRAEISPAPLSGPPSGSGEGAVGNPYRSSAQRPGRNSRRKYGRPLRRLAGRSPHGSSVGNPDGRDHGSGGKRRSVAGPARADGDRRPGPPPASSPAAALRRSSQRERSAGSGAEGRDLRTA